MPGESAPVQPDHQFDAPLPTGPSQALAKEIDRLLEGLELAELAHRVSHNLWLRCHLAIGIVTTAASGTATALLVSEVNNRMPLVISSLVASVGAALLTFLNPKETSQLHYNATVEYSSIRADLRQFYNLQSSSISFAEATAQLARFTERKQTVRSWAPSYAAYAWWRAQQMQERGVMTYRTDQP